MRIKVLIVSRNAWNQTNGNTLSNFFQDFKPDELAQVYCRDELPDNNLCNTYFKISESQLISSLFKGRVYAGERINISSLQRDKGKLVLAERERNFYNFFRSNRLIFLLWIRELIWKLGKWKSPELAHFIHDFNPDVIYTDAYDTFYTYNLVFHIQGITKVPIVLFHCDDQLTFRKFSLSPLFWINRLLLRKKVIKAINLASINYCIVDKQKDVYQYQLEKEFKILNKCADFLNRSVDYHINTPIEIIYAGNIYYGRWKTLAKLAKAIKQINTNHIKFILKIYTSNPITGKIKKKLNIEGSSVLKGYLPYQELREIQKQSDILLHVESFQLKEKLLTSLSFSTKLVDYFETGKCILAIGWNRSASIEYLKKHDAAIIVLDTVKLPKVLSNIVSNPQLIKDYSLKALQCGIMNHNKFAVLASFRDELIKLKKNIQ